MRKYRLSSITFTLVFAVSASTASLAANKKQSSSKGTQHEEMMTKEQRQKMADTHEKMAECLKSDKPLSECQSEMMKSCHDEMGGEGCPMMGHHMGKGHMSKDKSASSQESAESEKSDDHSQHH